MNLRGRVQNSAAASGLTMDRKHQNFAVPE